MNHRLAVAAFSVAFVVGTVAGCTCANPGAGTVHFTCESQSDCLGEERCVDGLCLPLDAGTGGGSGDDAGVIDGGCAALDEVCGDDVDDNCNGVLNDGCPCFTAGEPCYPFAGGLSSPTLRYPWDGGAGCAPGLQLCVNGTLAPSCFNPHVPQLEFCDGMDTDCDGNPDPPPPLCTCQAGRACYLGPPGTINAAPGGASICAAGVWADCGGTPACQGQVLPDGVEHCNGRDDDCNGLVDENPETPPCGPGVCASERRQCVDGGAVACVLSDIVGFSAAEVCDDGLDNNCNGAVDEGCTCVLDAGVPCWTGASASCPTDGGACRGQCRRGTQRCGLLSDGGSGYGACTGQTLPVTEVCTDSQDNDCDGTTDCVDSDCGGRSCGANGRLCSGSTCACQGNGGTPQASETTCTDGADNDCDGLTDCAETYCANRACGANGRTCVGTSCTCVADGGTTQAAGETLCSDGVDNDCDGLVDCAETSCAGQTCATGKTCVSGSCTSGDGGTPQTIETICNDGFDNDGDGLIDCEEGNTSASSCWDRTCASNGYKCRSGGCECRGNGGAIQVGRETTCFDNADNDCDGLKDCSDPDCLTDAGVCLAEANCSDGMDNDGDGRTDCADTDCIHRSCSGTQAASVCCGPWPAVPNTATCINLGTDPNNCGQCGVVCPSGACAPASGNGRSSGRCTCPGGLTAECPRPNSQQTCSASSLTCDCGDEDERCGSSSQGSRCQDVSGADFCYYP